VGVVALTGQRKGIDDEIHTTWPNDTDSIKEIEIDKASVCDAAWVMFALSILPPFCAPRWRYLSKRQSGATTHRWPIETEGVATEDQKDFLRGVSWEGYCAVIAQGFDAAKSTLEWYLGVTDHEPPSVLKTNLICQAHTSCRKSERHNKKKK
jgi:hypothetical protein